MKSEVLETILWIHLKRWYFRLIGKTQRNPGTLLEIEPLEHKGFAGVNSCIPRRGQNTRHRIQNAVMNGECVQSRMWVY